MKEIRKSKTEPPVLTDFKNNSLDKETGNYVNCVYPSFLNPGRKNYKKILLQEQFYLCAYCNTTIGEDNSTIEHWFSQNKCKTLPSYKTPSGEDINHNNLIAVCLGNNENPYFHHCDKQRGNLPHEDQDLTVKPQDPKYSFNTTFTYKGGKLICEENEAIQDDVDRKLNLNHQTLINFRNITLSQFIKSLNGNNTKEILEDQLKRYTTPSKEGKLRKYCTIIIEQIEKKLAQHAA